MSHATSDRIPIYVPPLDVEMFRSNLDSDLLELLCSRTHHRTWRCGYVYPLWNLRGNLESFAVGQDRISIFEE